ncbi:MAG: cell division protein ZapA [Ruminococcaceae bacterium]|nr:cell division protein ZapA [Oscillospiraceae bacterium]
MSNEKKRYSLAIADMQINIISDAAPEEIDQLVGILDRKMREINLKSRACSKNEAALLCALEFCAGNLSMADRIKTLEEREGKYATVLEGFKAKTAKLESDVEELRHENAVLRSLLSTQPAAPAEEALPEINPVSPTEFLAAVADAQNEAPAEVEKAPEAAEEKTEEKPKAKVRSRVGSMFDLLSFNEP